MSTTKNYSFFISVRFASHFCDKSLSLAYTGLQMVDIEQNSLQLGFILRPKTSWKKTKTESIYVTPVKNVFLGKIPLKLDFVTVG